MILRKTLKVTYFHFKTLRYKRSIFGKAALTRSSTVSLHSCMLSTQAERLGLQSLICVCSLLFVLFFVCCFSFLLSQLFLGNTSMNTMAATSLLGGESGSD